jgi:DNA-binding GntR family transcriptional regulator
VSGQLDSLRVTSVAAPLRQKVLSSLRNAITDGHFKPGDRLIERELCELTGVSRTLIREALRQLETEGLITTIPNKGPVVAKISRKEARDIYKVRGLLEAMIGQTLAESGSDKDIKALRKAFAKLSKGLLSQGPEARIRLKNEFYQVFFEVADNSIATSLLKLLNTRISILRATSMSQSGRPQQALKEIGDVITAIEARDGEAARAACLKHIDNACASALEVLQVSDD